MGEEERGGTEIEGERDAIRRHIVSPNPSVMIDGDSYGKFGSVGVPELERGVAVPSLSRGSCQVWSAFFGIHPLESPYNPLVQDQAIQSTISKLDFHDSSAVRHPYHAALRIIPSDLSNLRTDRSSSSWHGGAEVAGAEVMEPMDNM